MQIKALIALYFHPLVLKGCVLICNLCHERIGMVNRERLVNSFIEYVKIDSESTKEKKFANFIEDELKKIGLDVYIDNAGLNIETDAKGNIIAKLEGNKDKESIIFCCHLDTVTPGEGIKPVIKDDVIYSDGTTVLGGDNKAGIAAIIESLKIIKENNLDHGLIEVVFTICEENGLLGSKNLEFEKLQSEKALVFDSGGDPGQIIVKGPAQDVLNVKIHGRAAHAGVAPEEGISAINVAASAISKMKLLRVDKETTANIGIFEGGKATNIVTPEVSIKAEARSLCNQKLQAQSNHMKECFENAAKEFGAEVEVEISRMYSAFTIDENDELVNLAKKAYSNIGIEAFTESSGGGSDINILNAKGIKTINLGIGERKCHTLEEHLHIKDLVNVSKVILEIIKEI